jgi:hypothetical protein
MKKRNLLTLFLALTASGSLSAKEPAATIDPAAKAILEESIKATGGREAMARIKSRQITGKMTMPAQGMKMTLIMKQKAPAKTFTKMEIPEVMTIEQGYDGQRAWSKDSIQGLRELAGAELEQARESAAMFPELLIMDNLTSAKLLKEVEENGRTLKVIEVTSKDASDKTLYFDKATKLLAKMTSSFATGPDGAMAGTVSVSDYKEKDGVKYAAKVEVSVMGQEMQMTFSDVKHNIEMDDTIFAMPK